MTSFEVKKYYEDGDIEKLYKVCLKYFDMIDSWADRFFGDLLDEYELKQAQQQLNACQTKLNPIAGAFESLIVEYENNRFIKEEKTFEKVRVQDKDHCKAFARESVSDLRRYASDFTRYVQSAQNAVITSQSLLKRQAIEKGNKGIGATGDTSNAKSDDNRKWDE